MNVLRADKNNVERIIRELNKKGTVYIKTK